MAIVGIFLCVTSENPSGQAGAVSLLLGRALTALYKLALIPVRKLVIPTKRGE